MNNCLKCGVLLHDASIIEHVCPMTVGNGPSPSPSPSPTCGACASKDAEIAALRSRAEAAEREAERVTFWRDHYAKLLALLDVDNYVATHREALGPKTVSEWCDHIVNELRARATAAEAERDELRHFKATRTQHSTILKRAEAAEAALAERTRERDAALERERAADHLRPAYQQDALEQKRLRLAAEAREAALREALRPFVKEIDPRVPDGATIAGWPNVEWIARSLCAGDFRRAAAALAAPADVTKEPAP